MTHLPLSDAGTAALALACLAGSVDACQEPPPAAFTGWTLIDLPRFAEPPSSMWLTVPLDGEATAIELRLHTLRSPDFQLLVDGGDGRLVPTTPAPVRTYRGSVVGDPGAVVAASLLHDGLSAIIRLSDGETWVIEPASRVRLGAGPSHIVYAGSDVRAEGHHCATPASGPGPGELDADGGVAGTGASHADLAIETDFEFFQKNGSSAAATLDDIEMVVNGADAVFANDAGISYELSTVVVRTAASDPYLATTVADRLCEFRDNWNNAPESSIQRDLAHMFSGYPFAGGAIGMAWLGVVCNASENVCGGSGNAAYSIAESKYLLITPLYLRVGLCCHELGHNWNATHCDAQGNANCHIMCSSNNACGGIAGPNLKFDALAIAEMDAFRGSISCAPPVAGPLAPPFIDQFESNDIDSDRWIYVKGADVGSGGTAEPSGSKSLVLDSSGSNEFQDDEVRSNRILLAGWGAATCTYYTEHKGVERGKQLLVEYFDNSGAWTTLNSIVSDGVNQSSYTFWKHALPPGAMHDGFRLRFRTQGDHVTDDWYVDDVGVEASATCFGDLDRSGAVDGADLGLLLGMWNSGNPAFDLNGDGTVDGADLGAMLGGWGPCGS